MRHVQLMASFGRHTKVTVHFSMDLALKVALLHLLVTEAPVLPTRSKLDPLPKRLDKLCFWWSQTRLSLITAL